MILRITLMFLLGLTILIMPNRMLLAEETTTLTNPPEPIITDPFSNTADALKFETTTQPTPIMTNNNLSLDKNIETVWMEKMVISANKTLSGTMNIPQLITVLGEENIKNANASFTPDLLMQEAGILIQKTNYGGGVPFIRGMTGKQILLLIDGVRMNNSLYRFGPHQYLNTIDPDQIERIEVVHGPGSLFYGSDALGGVINVITKKHKDFTKKLSCEGTGYIRYGSADQQTVGRASFSANTGPVGYSLGGSIKNFGHVRGGRETGLQIPTGYHEEDYNINVNVRLDKNNELIASHQHIRQYDVPKTSEITLGGKIKYNYEPQSRNLTYLDYQSKQLTSFIDSLQVNLSYGTQKEGEEVINADPAIETHELNAADTFGTFLHLSSTVLKFNNLNYGLEFYTDKIKSTKDQINWSDNSIIKIKSAFPDGADYRLLGVYLQDELTILDNLKLQLGTRYSQVASTGNLIDPTTTETTTLSLDRENLSSSFGFLYKLTGHINLVGSIAQGFRAPNMEDFFGKVDFATEIPNPSLNPEKVLSYELGVKLGYSKLYTEFMTYLSNYTDLITRGTILDEGVEKYQRQNLDSARIFGAELSSQYYFNEEWSTFINAGWTYGEDKDRAPLRRIPPLTGAFGIKYQTEKYWVEYFNRFAAAQYRLSAADILDARIPEGGSPAYITFNLRGGVNITEHSSLNLTLENISDLDYKTHGSGINYPGTNILITYHQSISIL